MSDRSARADVSITLRAWLEDHPYPLRVVITMVADTRVEGAQSVKSIDEAVAIVRDVLTDLVTRGRDEPVTRP